MDFRNGKPRFTLTDMFVLFVIVALGMAVLLPFIQEAREKARQTECINNMRQLGLAFHNHCDMHKVFPASSSVTRNPDGSVTVLREIDLPFQRIEADDYSRFVAFAATVDGAEERDLFFERE